MGQEILYCFKCLTRLTSTDIDRGKGRRFGYRVACEKCLPDLLASLPPEEREAARPTSKAREAPARAGSSASHHQVPTSTPRAFRPSAERANPWPWVAGGGGLFLILLLGIALSSGGRSPAPPHPTRETAAPVAPAPPKKDPRLEEARESYAKARTLELAKPGELDAVVAAYEEAVRKADKTELFNEVVRSYDAAVVRRKEARLRADLDNDRAVRDALAREDFAAARTLAAKTSGGDWPARIREHAAKLLRELGAKAVDARQRAELRERAVRWGYPDLQSLLDLPDGWRPVFDGKSTECLTGYSARFWKVDNGALVPAVDPIQPLKTKEEFGDVDLRLRIEFADASNFAFWGRQSGEGSLGIEWDRRKLDVLRGSPREFILSLRGERVTLTLDGAAEDGMTRGRILKGPVQMGGVGRGWRVLGLDVREAPAEARTEAWRLIGDARSMDWTSPGSTRSWRIDGGGLIPIPLKPGEVRDTLQTRERLGEGELRLVFEIFGPVEAVTLAVRQGASGRAATTLAGGRIKSLGAGRHEIVMTCRGKTISAAVDGQGQDVYGQNFEDVGHCQISCQGDGLRILSLEWRDQRP